MFGVKSEAKYALRAEWTAEMDDHVVAAAGSPDGGAVAAAEVSGPIRIFDAGDGRERARMGGHRNGTTAVSWRYDSAMVASGGQDGLVRVWDARTGKELAAMEAGAGWVEAVAYAPYRKDLLLTAAGRTLRVWTSEGTLVQECEAHGSTISGIAWQSEEPYFSSICYGQLALFRTGQAAPMRRFAWKGSILAMAWSPDNNLVATGNQDASVHFWYRKSGRDLEMSGYQSKVRELAWDAGSRLLATGGSPTVIVWDCGGKGPAGSRPIQLAGHRELPSALAFQRKGALLASGCRGGKVCLWHPARSEAMLASAEVGAEVTQLIWSPEDTHLTVTTAAGRVARYAV